MTGSYYYPLNQPVKFQIARLQTRMVMQLIRLARVEVIKHEYRTVLSKSGELFPV